MSTKILLAGFGTMGRYYADAVIKNAAAWNVELVGIVDTDPARVADLPDSVPFFQDIRDALGQTGPQLVINATNNESHIDIIRALEAHPEVKGFLAEKPLVNSGPEEVEATARLATHFVSMNMITNFSAASIGLKEWVDANPRLKLIGLEGVWGKDRRADTRPTPGIANDIVHPVGLMQSIFNVRNWDLKRADGLYGTLSTDRAGNKVDCVYQYDLAFDTDVAPVRMDCSFAWKQQARRVSAFFEKPDGGYTAAELFLDEAGEGGRSDFFCIHDISADFKTASCIYESPRAMDNKLAAYVERSLRVLRGEAPAESSGLIGLQEEEAIGAVYNLLYPSGNRADLMKCAHLNIADVSPQDAPVVPGLPALDQETAAGLEKRIRAFTPQTAKPVNGPAAPSL